MFNRILSLGLTSLFILLSPTIARTQLSENIIAQPDSSSQISNQKRLLIQEFLELTGGSKTMQQVSQVMLAQFQQEFQTMLQNNFPGSEQLSPEERQEVQTSINRDMNRILTKYNQLFMERIDFNQIIEQVYYPLYDKYYSEEDLRVLIEFYQTPTGQKTIQVMPQLLQESIQRTSQIIGPQVISIIQEIMDEERERIQP